MKPQALLILVALGVATPAVAAEPTFADIKPGHPATGAVQRVVKAGLLSGFADKTYRGTQLVTRYELLNSVAKVLPGKTPPALGPIGLASDVPDSHWALPAVTRWQNLGVGLDLWPQGYVSGDSPATRFDLAYLATRTCAVWDFRLPSAADGTAFYDVAAEHWAAPAVILVSELGLMGGVTATRFAGDNPIDRFTAAIVLDRLMAKVKAGPTRPAAAKPVPVPAAGQIYSVQGDGTVKAEPPVTGFGR
jgi:hypothetical protein